MALLYCDDNTWQLKERSRDALPALLEGSSVVTSYFCLLRFRLEESRKKRSCLVFWDAVEKNRYRQLLTQLGSMKVH